MLELYTCCRPRAHVRLCSFQSAHLLPRPSRPLQSTEDKRRNEASKRLRRSQNSGQRRQEGAQCLRSRRSVVVLRYIGAIVCAQICACVYSRAERACHDGSHSLLQLRHMPVMPAPDAQSSLQSLTSSDGDDASSSASSLLSRAARSFAGARLRGGGASTLLRRQCVTQSADAHAGKHMRRRTCAAS